MVWWARKDDDLPDEVRSVIALHDRDWVTREGKLTPARARRLPRVDPRGTGVDVAIDRVPVQVPVPVEVPMD
ncbi:hypothetical protein [Patulibacter americanus]|uniref:hypothetical protein n=1 Tax=Patulibacter americanus TaxID=588672 RepID=UPI0003B36CD0|nr:hypothetical protein [Patulibacter americanus]